MKRILYIIPAAMLLLASCASSQSAYTVGGEWQVTNMNGKSITPSDETPLLALTAQTEMCMALRVVTDWQEPPT